VGAVPGATARAASTSSWHAPVGIRTTGHPKILEERGIGIFRRQPSGPQLEHQKESQLWTTEAPALLARVVPRIQLSANFLRVERRGGTLAIELHQPHAFLHTPSRSYSPEPLDRHISIPPAPPSSLGTEAIGWTPTCGGQPAHPGCSPPRMRSHTPGHHEALCGPSAAIHPPTHPPSLPPPPTSKTSARMLQPSPRRRAPTKPPAH
jgi:hypothetical protein